MPHWEGRMAIHIRRRTFISLLGGVAAWPLTARAQKIPLIAWLDGGGQPRPDSLVAFRRGLNNRGYVDGRNVVIGIHGVEQPEQLSEAITELMRESQRRSLSMQVGKRSTRPRRRPQPCRLCSRTVAATPSNWGSLRVLPGRVAMSLAST